MRNVTFFAVPSRSPKIKDARIYGEVSMVEKAFR